MDYYELELYLVPGYFCSIINNTEMKRVLINSKVCLFLVLFICSCKSGVPQLICVKESDQKWGYINIKGDYVIPPQFDNATPFSDNGLAMVLVDSHYGYVNKKGKMVIAPKFDNAVPFVGGVAVVATEDGAPSLINASGRVIREFKEARYIEMFTPDGLALMLTNDGKFGYINDKGKVVIPPEYSEASTFSEGYAFVIRNDRKLVIINARGKEVAEVDAIADIDDVYNCYPFSDGLARLFYDRSVCMFIDPSGKVVVPARKEAAAFSESLAGCYVGDYGGFIDKKGKMVINPMYEEIGFFHSGLALVLGPNEMYGYINKKGETVIHNQFDDCTSFYGDIAAVCPDNLWGIINKKGEYLVIPRFEKILLDLSQAETESIDEYEYPICESNYFDHGTVVNSILDNISGETFFGIKPGIGPEVLMGKEESFERSHYNPLVYFSKEGQEISKEVSRSRVKYSFEKGIGIRPAIFPGETSGQPWPFEGIRNIDVDYTLQNQAQGKAGFLAKQIAEALVVKRWSVEANESREEYLASYPYSGNEKVNIKLKYGYNDLSVHIDLPKVVEPKIIEGSTLPEEYSWLVNGGDWMDNPLGYDSPVFTFNKDKSFKFYDYNDITGDINKTGRYEIANGVNLLLRDEDGKLITMNLNLEDERILYNNEWLFAQNGTKFDQKMREQFGPFHNNDNKWDYYHHDCSQNGVFVKFKSNADGELQSATFTQYTVSDDNKYDLFGNIDKMPVKQSVTLIVKNGNQFVDGNGNIVATGSNDWPNNGIIISGKGKNWFLGNYGCE